MVHVGYALVCDYGVVGQLHKYLGLVEQLRVLGVFLLKLDSQLLPGGDVDGVEDLAKRSLRKFFKDLVLVMYEDLH